VKHRLYVDEVGNSDMGASQDPNHRYLSLTGVILELGYVDSVLYPKLEALKKRFFGSHADEPVVLHRKEIIQKKPPFEVLRDPSVEQDFATELLKLREATDFVVITAVIYKLEHQQKYAAWRYDPYHYCVHVILERYVMWNAPTRIQGRRDCGVPRQERRHASEEVVQRYLGAWYRLDGSTAVSAEPDKQGIKSETQGQQHRRSPTSDVVAYPAWKVGLVQGNADELPGNLTGRIGRLLVKAKFDRNSAGAVMGWDEEGRTRPYRPTLSMIRDGLVRLWLLPGSSGSCPWLLPGSLKVV
jgi:hypothetical protein